MRGLCVWPPIIYEKSKIHFSLQHKQALCWSSACFSKSEADLKNSWFSRLTCVEECVTNSLIVRFFGFTCVLFRWINVWLDILFLSNHNIHKSSCRLCFWASNPLIDRFYWNLPTKGSVAQKQRPCELLWMLWFDEKSISRPYLLLLTWLA